jgi:hypothetical protein
MVDPGIKKEYDQFFEANRQMGMKIIRSGQEAVPMLFMIKNKEVTITPLRSIIPNTSPMEIVKPIIAMHDPDFYMVLAEAWMKAFRKSASSKQLIDNMRWGYLSKMVEKKEALTLFARSKDGTYKRMEMHTIYRNEKGGIIFKKSDWTNAEVQSERLP